MNIRQLTFFLCVMIIGILPVSKLQAQEKNDTNSMVIPMADSFNYSEKSREDSATDIQNLEYYTGNKKERRRLIHLLKRIARRDESQHPFSPSFYYRLANTYARLKLYPQAMKYYYYSNPQLQEQVRSQYFSTGQTLSISDSSAPEQEDAQYLSSNQIAGNMPGILFSNEDTLFNGSEASSTRSHSIPSNEIVRPFKNGQAGVAYAVVLLVKQPAAGHRTPFTGLNNVGHTFVTLIKYNGDQTCVSRSFGFYPLKSFPLEGSPFHPSAPATYKDDSRHDWDEAVGKFVSQQQFFRILRLIRQYNRRHYNLNSNNCTDFGLCIAGMAGIQINGTHGTWPLGSGNTPASTGQSVLEGKLLNTDTDNQNGLFISANDKIK